MTQTSAVMVRERILELRDEMGQLEDKRRELRTKLEECERNSLYSGLFAWHNARKCKRVKRRLRRVESAIGHKGDALGKLGAIQAMESS